VQPSSGFSCPQCWNTYHTIDELQSDGHAIVTPPGKDEVVELPVVSRAWKCYCYDTKIYAAPALLHHNQKDCEATSNRQDLSKLPGLYFDIHCKKKF
jgi:hypothetical protein